nr:secreted RxLR effector protein 161-like [Nicotiana tomentosiformis]
MARELKPSAVALPVDVLAPLSQFLQAPQVPHMLAVIHVLKYFSAAPALGVLLSHGADFSLRAYSDSDWAICAMSRKSVSRYFITFGGCPISWKSKKQQVVPLSSAEAEYRALRQVVIEVSWLTRLLADFGISISNPVHVFFVTTRLPFTLLRIQYFMSAPNTSRLIVIMCATASFLV